MPVITGTSGNDTLNGTGEADLISGLDGDDALFGLGGDDELQGGDGADRLEGGAGSDLLYGGGGDDLIFELVGGNDHLFGENGADRLVYHSLTSPGIVTAQLHGGAGDDFLEARIVYGDSATMTGGSGRDRLYSSGGDVVIDAGADADLVEIETAGAIWRISLGAGADLLVLSGNFLPSGYYVATITDFVAGDAGDAINHDDYTYPFGHPNPFVSGLLRLVQDGADTLLQMDNDVMAGPSQYETIIVFENVSMGSLTAHNLGGFAPDGSVVAGITLSGSAEIDFLTGHSGDDLIVGNGGNDVLYGASGNDLLEGGDGNDDLFGQRGTDEMFGGGGNDLLSAGYGDSADGGAGTDRLHLSLSGAPSGVTIDTATFLAAPLALGGGIIQSMEILERLTGSWYADTIDVATQATLLVIDGSLGNDLVTSNASSVSFSGNWDDDWFITGAAADWFDGGEGVDTIDYRQAMSGVTVQLGRVYWQIGTGAGGDQLYDVDNVAGSAFADTIEGSDYDNLLQGSGGNDSLKGWDGADTLDGGGGDDLLYGGAGDDTYFADAAGDRVEELAGEGRDLVYASVNYALSAASHVEILSAISLGGTDPLQLSGNELNNEIYGNAGANTLRGGGGADLLLGGFGDDIYYTTSGAETIFEYGGQGRDIVYASLNHALAAGSHVEVLSAISLSGTDPLQLSGNELNNEVYGNAGANVLRGGGGSDLLLGGFGDDTYYITSGAETIFEYGGQDRDIIYTALSHTLAAGSHVEILSSISLASTEAINLGGNEFDNQIYGNAGSNILYGGGGFDFLVGGYGDDTYYILGGNELLFESAGQGRDIAYANVSYGLNGTAEIEILSASSIGGTDAIALTGNELAQELDGNNGANFLDGKGGSDLLVGYGGVDTFAFTSALGVDNVDYIHDFVGNLDKMALDDAVFAGLTSGALPAGAFVAGGAATETDDRIVYNSATGQLFFDADGSGGGAAVQFASVASGTIIAASDFTVI